MNITSEAQYQELRTRADRNNAWVDSKRTRNGKGWASYRAEEVPADCVISNEERSAIEVWEFVHNPPDRYFLYVSQDKAMATTWTGDELGKISFGREYRCPAMWRPSVRVPVTIHAINGLTYHGTYFKSSGDYARVKMAKHS